MAEASCLGGGGGVFLLVLRPRDLFRATFQCALSLTVAASNGHWQSEASRSEPRP